MVTPSKTVVLVDPLSTARFLAEAARASGKSVLAIYTFPQEALDGILKPYMNDPTLFDQIIFAKSIEQIEAELRTFTSKGFAIEAVIPGSEEGVERSDLIAERFQLPRNVAELAPARRDKAIMKKVARAAGLRTAEYQACHQFGEAEQFAQRLGFPVVIKFPDGSGTEGVYIVKNRDELLTAWDKVFAFRDAYNKGPQFALIEEYLGGTEYIVNLFGDGKDVHVTDIWRYEKISNRFADNLYYSTFLEQANDKAFDELRRYAIALSKAVGIQTGPVHAEIKIDSKGPVMIEIASRLSGLRAPKMSADFSNFDPIKSCIEVFSRGTCAVPKVIEFKKWVSVASCPTEAVGVIKKIHGVQEIQNLPSYHSHVFNSTLIDRAEPTLSLTNIPFTAWMVSDDYQELVEDTKKTHELFQIETE